MKKLISTLCSLLMLTAFPLSNVYAEGNPDLQALASSLGADTDHFNFKNYADAKVGDEMMSALKRQMTPIEVLLCSPQEALKASAGGECSGMSILEILVHNGVIKASDIQEGAEHLSDINFDDKVNDILTYYQMLQVFQKQYLSMRYYWCNHGIGDSISDLVTYGKKAVDEGKYFYIAFNSNKGAHAIVGIGEADGEWEFNGRKYNKCILTLDCNVGSFTEENCIYLNTENNTFYFPAYDFTENEAQILMITGDETFLNYKGYISPSYTSDTDTSNLTEIEIGNYKRIKKEQFGWDLELSVTDDNGTRNYTSKGLEPLDITKNCLINLFETNKQYTFSADKNTEYKLKVNVSPDDPKEASRDVELFQRTEKCFRYCYTINFDKDTEIVLGENFMSRYADNYSNFNFELRNEEKLNKNEPFHDYHILGNNVGTITMFERNDGILLTTDKQFDATIIFSDSIHNENSSVDAFSQPADNHVVLDTISSVNNIMLRYNEADDRIAIFIDKNGDDIYDKELEKGDANCDGIIDGKDASMILSAYATQSVNTNLFCDVNVHYCDWDENGIIDARDATAVLTYYAKNSVQ